MSCPPALHIGAIELALPLAHSHSDGIAGAQSYAMDGPDAGGRAGSVRLRDDQPGSISVPIRSAGQTRLTGALVNASKDGFDPSGRSTM